MSIHKNKRRGVIEFRQVFTYPHLLASHAIERRGKRNRETNIKYDAYMERNLQRLLQSLREDTYEIRSLYGFTIYEPKKREIVANQYEDKIVQRCLCDYLLQPLIANKLIFDNYASQPGKGTDLARERFEMMLKSYVKKYHTNEGYIGQIDIKSYFASIDRELAYQMVCKLPMDDRCKKLLHMQIYAYQPEKKVGVCIGFQSMQWLAVYYLDGLDHYIKETLRVKYYGRYMDDFVFICRTKKEAEEIFDKIKIYAEEKLKLKLNPKSTIRPLSDNTNWLGFKYKINSSNTVLCGVNKKTLKRYLRRLKKYNKLYLDEELAFENIADSINSWRSHLLKCANSTTMIKYLNHKVKDILGEVFYERFNKEYSLPEKKTPKKRKAVKAKSSKRKKKKK